MHTDAWLINPHAAQPIHALHVLLCDSPIPPVAAIYPTYGHTFASLLTKSLTQFPLPFGLSVKTWDVVNQHYPPSSELTGDNVAILITGSAASAYQDVDWINKLITFVALLPQTVKIIGICFGHQIVARAFGSTVTLNPAGWELGVRECTLSETGRKLLSRDNSSTVRIHQMHRDYVPTLPKGFENLCSTPDCEIQGMVSYISPESSQIRIITLQGHPEYSPEIVTAVIDYREARGILSKELADRSREYAKEHDQGVWVAHCCLSILQDS